MKHTTSIRPSLRFRRWSRKAYAAFASIGRCVTIGCLPKSVADSSLSKQKAAGTAGHTDCSEASAWKGITEGLETDIGIPLGGGTTLTGNIMEVQTTLQVLCCTSGIRPCTHTNGEELYIYKTRNHIGTDYRRGMRHISQSITVPILRASFLLKPKV